MLGHSKLSSIGLALDSLSIYRGLLEDQVLRKLKTLLIYQDQAEVEFREIINLYNDFYFELTKSGMVSLKDLIIEKIIFDENPFSFKLQAVQPVLQERLRKLLLMT